MMNKNIDIELKIKSNFHTHTFLCKHALGDAEDYVKRAIDLNYHTIAITDHGPFPKFLQKIINSRRMSLDQYSEIYLDSIKMSKELHKKDQILILSGVEIEYMDELLPLYSRFLNDLDFLILGQHYIKVNEQYKSIYAKLTNEDLDIYANAVIKAIESGLFKIVAHPEIFMWSIDEWNDKCIEVSEKIIEAAVRNQVALELNANGIRNSLYQRKETYLKDGRINFPYPRVEFWELVKKYDDAIVVINDDAHAPNRLCDKYTKMLYEFADAIGLKYTDRIKGLND